MWPARCVQPSQINPPEAFCHPWGSRRRPLAGCLPMPLDMIIGHIAVAYAVRARLPRTNLVGLLVATMLPDLADFALPQGNQCRTSCELYTHAFPAFVVLAAFAGVMAWFIWHRRAMVAAAATLVLVHILCDVLTGYKPFWLGGPQVGFDLYGHPVADFYLESLMLIGGFTLLRMSATPPRLAVRFAVPVLLIIAQCGGDYYFMRALAAEASSRRAASHGEAVRGAASSYPGSAAPNARDWAIAFYRRPGSRVMAARPNRSSA